MWHWGTWFRGGLGSAGLVFGVNDLGGLFQPNDSVIPASPDSAVQPHSLPQEFGVNSFAVSELVSSPPTGACGTLMAPNEGAQAMPGLDRNPAGNEPASQDLRLSTAAEAGAWLLSWRKAAVKIKAKMSRNGTCDVTSPSSDKHQELC